jgi:hypothetical protein
LVQVVLLEMVVLVQKDLILHLAALLQQVAAVAVRVVVRQQLTEVLVVAVANRKLVALVIPLALRHHKEIMVVVQ